MSASTSSPTGSRCYAPYQLIERRDRLLRARPSVDRVSRRFAAKRAGALAPSLSDATWIAGVAIAYFLAAKIGLALATVGVTVTLVWPPSGVAVAAMLLRGPRVWPGVMIGAFAANATTDAPLGVAVFTAIGNPLESVVAATLLSRVGAFDAALERARDV